MLLLSFVVVATDAIHIHNITRKVENEISFLEETSKKRGFLKDSAEVSPCYVSYVEFKKIVIIPENEAFWLKNEELRENVNN